MGIPKFYRAVTDNFSGTASSHHYQSDMKKYITQQYPGKFVNSTSVDMNSLKHNAYRLGRLINKRLQILGQTNFVSHLDVCIYLLHNIIQTYQPRNTLLLATDGVPTVAKMVQQKARRYGNALQPSHGPGANPRDPLIQDLDISWLLTTGTYYMDELEIGIGRWLEEQAAAGKLPLPTQIILSGHGQPGEGEHKILNKFRTHQIVKHPQGLDLIHGEDADLIVLGLILNQQLGNHILIVREGLRHDFDKLNNYHNDRQGDNRFYTNVYRLGLVDIEDLNLQLRVFNGQGMGTLDFSFLTMLMGNDFVTGLIETKNFPKFFNLLLEIYTQEPRDPIVEPDTSKLLEEEAELYPTNIDWAALTKFLGDLLERRETLMGQLIEQSNQYLDTDSGKLLNLYSQYGYEEFRTAYYTRQFNLPHGSATPADTIEVLRYVELPHYYVPDTDKIADVCKQYLMTWIWNFRLYMGSDILTNCYAYPYWFAPLLSDLVAYINHIGVEQIEAYLLASLRDIGFAPIHAIHQQMIVLPPPADYLIPAEVKSRPLLREAWRAQQLYGLVSDKLFAVVTDRVNNTTYLDKPLIPPIDILRMIWTVYAAFQETDVATLERYQRMFLWRQQKGVNNIFELAELLLNRKLGRQYLRYNVNEILIRAGKPLIEGRIITNKKILRGYMQTNRNTVSLTKIATSNRKLKSNKIPLDAKTLAVNWAERYKQLPEL